MTAQAPDFYDEPGSRTRYAWLRTALVLLAVSALVVRGLYLRDAPPWLYAVVGLDFGAFAVLAVVRLERLGPRESPGITRGFVVATAATAVVCSLIAVTSLGLLSA